MTFSAPLPSGASYATTSPENTPRDDRIDLWIGVLMRLADGYPASKYAQLGPEDLEEMATTWRDDLPAVPALAIPELHRRTMSKALSTFAPSIGDYRATWLDPAWDFWADSNADAEKNAPAMPMLPEGPRETDGPGLTAAALQNARLRAGKAMICCECYNDKGIALSATLSLDKTLWRCAEDVCGFLLDVKRSDAAPIRPRLGIAKPSIPTKNEDEEEAHSTARGRATLSDIRRAAKECELDFEAMPPEELADFSAWVNWWRRNRGAAPMNYAALTLTWAQCEAEMQARLQERLQA